LDYLIGKREAAKHAGTEGEPVIVPVSAQPPDPPRHRPSWEPQA